MTGFILTTQSGKKSGYTTIAAILEDKENVFCVVSKNSIYTHPFDIIPYINGGCTIEKIEFKTKGDIIRERNSKSANE